MSRGPAGWEPPGSLQGERAWGQHRAQSIPGWPDGTSAPLEIVLLAKASSGCAGVIQLLEWLELPDSFLL
ncbi:hypothetical protein DV515_00016614, partial [Chloebia gouldiae]